MQDIIKKYYKAIDESDLDTALSLFSEDISYQRGSQLIVGKKDLEDFYHKHRLIKEGEHEIEEIKTDGLSTTVKGRFTGRLKSEEQVQIKFEDIFEFADQKIVKRKTIFPGRQI